MTVPKFTRTRQPQGPVAIDWGNPLTRGLISVWSASVGLLKTKEGYSRPLGGTPTIGSQGVGVSLNGTSDSISLGADALTAPTGTRIALIKPNSTSGSRNISAMATSGTGFRLNGGAIEITVPGSYVVQASSPGDVADGETCSVAIRYDASETGIYKNGHSLGTQSALAPGSANNGTDFLGQNGLSAQYFDGVIYCHLSFDRVLSDAAIKSLSENPWQVFTPQARQVWVSTVGGVNNTSLAASASAVATSTANLTTAKRLAASASATATATASLTTAKLLQAAPSATATASADLSTAIQFSASATATATATASLTTGINLQATAAATATATADLTANGAGLSANATASATATASLTTSITLQAAASAAATATATLLTAIRLSASAQAQATATASLTANGGAWSANAVANCIATANLTTQILLAANASAQATVAAALTTQIRLAAQAAARAAATADLSTTPGATPSAYTAYLPVPDEAAYLPVGTYSCVLPAQSFTSYLPVDEFFAEV